MIRSRIVFFILCLLAVACTRDQTPPVRAHAGPFTVEARLAPDPPRERGNTLDIVVLDATGERAAHADVDVEYFMPAMGAMPEMRGTGEIVPRGAGLFRANLDFPMGGSWTLYVRVRRGEQTGEAKLALTVGRSGLVAEGGDRAADSVAHYTCSMHPSVRQAEPGTCPICSMNLVPVTDGELRTGTITLEPARLQELGVRFAPAERRSLTIERRTVGRVAYDETALHDVSLKIGGWVEQLFVDETGQEIERGDPLFTLYSPELYAAQEELLIALRSQRAARTTALPTRADYLVAAARRRLALWDLADEQIDAIARSSEPRRAVPILSPVDGYVIEKEIVAGAAVEPGRRLYRIAALDRVWIEADVYEVDAAIVDVGARARISLPSAPGNVIEGRVAFLYPFFDNATRTIRARIELDNPERRLRPDMYADVVFEQTRADRLVVPTEAVLHAGERSFVFVVVGEGRFAPQRVTTGLRSKAYIEILEGLQEGERVVVSGNFLIAAESRLKTAMEQWQ